MWMLVCHLVAKMWLLQPHSSNIRASMFHNHPESRSSKHHFISKISKGSNIFQKLNSKWLWFVLAVGAPAAQAQENKSESGVQGPLLVCVCPPACLASVQHSTALPAPELWRRWCSMSPRLGSLFHRERHLSHRASSSRKLQLKPKATTLSDMYPSRAGASEHELDDPSSLSLFLTHSLFLSLNP